MNRPKGKRGEDQQKNDAAKDDPVTRTVFIVDVDVSSPADGLPGIRLIG